MAERLQQKSIQSIHVMRLNNPRIITDALGCQMGEGGGFFFFFFFFNQPNLTFRRKHVICSLKTERPGYISTIPHFLLQKLKSKYIKEHTKGEKKQLFHKQLPLVKTVINGLAFVFFMYILTLVIHH